VKSVDTWVLAHDASGAPDFVPIRIECEEADIVRGEHYDAAMSRCEALGYEPMGVFDERDPAGRKMLSLMSFEGWKQQESIPGDTSKPIWSVPLTVDMTLSARIQAHGDDPNEALNAARQFAASSSGNGLFSLDEGNYRGASDFYCGDPETIEKVDEQLGPQVGSESGAAQPSQRPEQVVTLPQATGVDTSLAAQFGRASPRPSVSPDQLEDFMLAALDIGKCSPPIAPGTVVKDQDELAAAPLSNVRKTVLQVTVLHRPDENVENLSLAQIGREIDAGDFLGSYSVTSCVAVPQEALHEEQLALGNDGSFFGGHEVEDGEDKEIAAQGQGGV
jgi:hypothetical protein